MMTTIVTLAVGMLMLCGVFAKALSAAAEIPMQEGKLIAIPVAASTTIYKGALVGRSSGYARELNAGDAFAGVAYETVDNSSGSAGDKYVQVWVSGIFEFALSGAAISNNERELYASDDATLTTTKGSNSYIGTQTEVPATGKVRVRIEPNHPLMSLVKKVTTKASATNVAIALGDLNGIIVVTGTTASNLNLPAAASAGAGAWVTFVKTGASGALTIEPNASETIDGGANNAEMDAAADSVTIVCDGTGWYITAKKIAA